MKRKLVFPYLFLQKSLLSAVRNSRPEKLGNFPKQVKQYIFLYQRPFSQNFNNNDSTTQVFLFFKNLKNKFFRNTSESPKKIPILMSSPSSFSVVLKPQKNFYAAFYSFFCKCCLHPNNLYFIFSIQHCEIDGTDPLNSVIAIVPRLHHSRVTMKMILLQPLKLGSLPN